MTVRILGLRAKLNNLILTNIKAVSVKIESLQLPDRLKGTIIEKWAKYWKQLSIDYRDVVLDVGKQAQEKPLKAGIYGAVLTACYLAAKRNPDEESFIENLRQHNNEMVLIHESCHNPESAMHLKFIEKCYNEGIIRRLSLGVVSFMWLDNYSEVVALYKAMCPYLKPDYLTFNQRIIDVGFWNKWWTLENKMIDYDVNM